MSSCSLVIDYVSMLLDIIFLLDAIVLYIGIVEHWWYKITFTIFFFNVTEFYFDQFVLNFGDLLWRAVAALRHTPRRGPPLSPSACPCPCSHLASPTPPRHQMESGT